MLPTFWYLVSSTYQNGAKSMINIKLELEFNTKFKDDIFS